MDQAAVEENHVALRRFDSDFRQTVLCEEDVEGIFRWRGVGCA